MKAFLVFCLCLIGMCCSYPHMDDVTVDEGPLKYKIETAYPGKQHSELFVFVGEKVEVVDVIPPKGEVWFDSAFDAKYRVIEHVYGRFDGEYIEFRVYDHYGIPDFTKFKHALLFVVKHEEKLYHEKYLYYDVYQTTSGKWASCGDPYREMEAHQKPFAPKPLNFAEPVVFDLNILKEEADAKEMPMRNDLAQPYFEITDGKAVCKMGAYVDELFLIMKDGYLKAREIYPE